MSDAMKAALTECEAAFKKSNEAGEHPANAEAFRAFRAGWYARADSVASETEDRYALRNALKNVWHMLEPTPTGARDTLIYSLAVLKSFMEGK